MLLGNGSGIISGVENNDNLLDCLEELATAKIEEMDASSSLSNSNKPNDDGIGSKNDNIQFNFLDSFGKGGNANRINNTSKTQNTTGKTSASSFDKVMSKPQSPHPPLPGIHRILNLRIELPRHLHVQTLSSFLLSIILLFHFTLAWHGTRFARVMGWDGRLVNHK